MANIKFLIRHPHEEQLQTISVSYRFGRNDKLLYSLPLKTEAFFWDAERMRVKNSVYCRYADEVNATLNVLSQKLEGFINEAARNGTEVSKATMKDFLDGHFKKKKVAEDFHSFFQYYIDLCDTRLNGQRSGQTISYKGKREYARTLFYIEQYEKARRVSLDFKDIDLRFYDDFVSFLQSQNLATNTIGNKITFLKALMEAAYKRGLTDNNKYKFFHTLCEESDSIALNEKELERIAHCDLHRHPKLERVRDMFIVGCWTGLRFSDVTRLRPTNIKDGMITIRQQKTDKNVVIPIHKEFLRIWESYGGCLPRAISNQKFNEYVKLVCKASFLREKVTKSITRGGRRETATYEKWQLVTSHTARRSFATNLYLSGFPSISIMAITGHKTEAAFLKYIKVSHEEHARMLSKHWEEQKRKHNDS